MWCGISSNKLMNRKLIQGHTCWIGGELVHGVEERVISI